MNKSDKLNKLPIEKRLLSVFRRIALLLSATGVIACVAMGIVSTSILMRCAITVSHRVTSVRR